MKYIVMCSSRPLDESDAGYFCGEYDGERYESKEEAEETLKKAKEHEEVWSAWIKEVD